MVDMFEEGIIDPAKVVLTAVRDATLASLMMTAGPWWQTAEQKVRRWRRWHASGMGGMGGMGGMPGMM